MNHHLFNYWVPRLPGLCHNPVQEFCWYYLPRQNTVETWNSFSHKIEELPKINPFLQASVFILCTFKKPENIWIFGIARRYRMRTLVRNGLSRERFSEATLTNKLKGFTSIEPFKRSHPGLEKVLLIFKETSQHLLLVSNF